MCRWGFLKTCTMFSRLNVYKASALYIKAAKKLIGGLCRVCNVCTKKFQEENCLQILKGVCSKHVTHCLHQWTSGFCVDF